MPFAGGMSAMSIGSLEQRRITILQGGRKAPHHPTSKGRAYLSRKLVIDAKAFVEMPLVRGTVYVAKRCQHTTTSARGTEPSRSQIRSICSLWFTRGSNLPETPCKCIVVVAERFQRSHRLLLLIFAPGFGNDSIHRWRREPRGRALQFAQSMRRESAGSYERQGAADELAEV